MKKIIVLAIAIALSTGAYAGESFRDRVDNWLSNSDSDNESGTLRGCIADGETEGVDPNVPVGEGLLLLSVLAGGYAVVKKRKSIQ